MLIWREEKSISTLTDSVNYITGHLKPFGDGHQIAGKHKKKKVNSVLLSNCERAGQSRCVNI